MAQRPPADPPPPGMGPFPAAPGPPAGMGQAGWAPPGTPAFAPAPPHRNQAPLLVALLVLVLAAGVGAFVLLSDDDEAGQEGPIAAVQRFNDAGTCEAIIDVSTAHYRETTTGATSAEEFVALCEQQVTAAEAAGEVALTDNTGRLEGLEIVSEDGDRATVEGTWISAEGDEVAATYTVLREDGTWRVDSVGSVDQGPSPSPTEPSAGSEAPSAEASGSAEPDANGNLPEDIVDSFVTASASADCETLGEVLADWDQQSVETCRTNRTPNPNPAEVLDIRFEGLFEDPDPAQPDMQPGTAVVVATMDYNQGPGDWTFWLLLDDGLWRIYHDIPA